MYVLDFNKPYVERFYIFKLRASMRSGAPPILTTDSRVVLLGLLTRVLSLELGRCLLL